MHSYHCPTQLAVDDSLARSKMYASQGADAASGLDKAGVDAIARRGSHDELRSPARNRGNSQPPAALLAAPAEPSVREILACKEMPHHFNRPRVSEEASLELPAPSKAPLGAAAA